MFKNGNETVAISSKTVDSDGNVAFSIYDKLTNRTYSSTQLSPKNTWLKGNLDIKFNVIEGANTYAFDINRNGIVDEGEIFDNSVPIKSVMANSVEEAAAEKQSERKQLTEGKEQPPMGV